MAKLLFRLRFVLLAGCVACGAWFLVTIVRPGQSSAVSLLPLAAGLWFALALGVGYTLTEAPPAITADDGIWRRIKKRLLQFGFAIGLIAVLALGGFTVMLTMRAIDLAAA